MRFNSDGTLDSSFDSDGWVELPRHFGTRNIDMQADGKLVISGVPDNTANFARLNSDGSLDTSFDIDGLFLYARAGCCASPTISSTTISNGKLVALASLELIRLDLDPSVPTFDSISDTVDVLDDGGLELVLAANSMSENGGSVTATVTRLTLDLSEALTVTVISLDSSEVAVPATVTIPVDATSATFTVDAVDDQLLDDSQTVTIFVTNGSLVLRGTLDVTDFEELTVSIVGISISENGGETMATVTRTDPSGDLTVNLLSHDTSEAVVVASVVIADGQMTSPAFAIDAVDDALLDGSQTVTLTASATGYVGGSDTLVVTDLEELTVSITDGSISENGGATTATVARTDPTGDLTVNLLSDDTSEATVMASVVIADGQMTSPAFAIDAVDDDHLDATQTVAVTASAAGYISGSDSLEVLDHETLALSIDQASISEDGGSTMATVTRSNIDDLTQSLTVTLTSNDTTEAAVAPTVEIPTGSASATIAIAAVDDAILDGTQTVAITSTATGYVGSNATLDVTDHETLTLTIADESISENGGSTTATVTRTDPGGDLTVALTSSDATEATVVNSIVIPDGSTVSPSFPIAAVDDLIVDSTITVVVTATASLYADASATVDVLDHETWTNPSDKNDVNLDSFVTSRDVLNIINELNRNGPRLLPERDGSSVPEHFYDANKDGFITPNDVLVVINFLNSRVTGEGEFPLWVAPFVSVQTAPWSARHSDWAPVPAIDDNENGNPYPMRPTSRHRSHLLIDRLRDKDVDELLASELDVNELLYEESFLILSHKTLD
jgi:hypothetical protein